MDRRCAVDQLNRYLPLFAECIEHGWGQWKTKYTQQHRILDARARASVVYCEIKEEAMRIFDRVDGVVVKTRNGSVFIYIGDDILVRFKKLKPSGHASNIMTGSQRCLYGQQPIPGFLPGNHITAGYVLDDSQQSIQRMLLVYQEENRILWTIELERNTGMAAEVVEMPKPQELPKSGKRVLPRHGDKTYKKDTAQ